jgi:hypothetical protein
MSTCLFEAGCSQNHSAARKTVTSGRRARRLVTAWLLSAEGGHVGFFNDPDLARRDRDALWAENRLIEFLAERLQSIDKTSPDQHINL